MKYRTIVLAGFVYLTAATLAGAAVVTISQSCATRPQNGITYGVLDFRFTPTPGSDFLNYRLIVTCNGGANCLHDPARLQDDRQYNSTNEAANSGSVDTYASTVMAAAAKEDGGYTSAYNFNIYNPVGTGAAPPFPILDWSVFDTNQGDDGDLTDHPDGPFAVTAPYHVARVLTTFGSSSTWEFRAFDTRQVGVPQIFQGTFAGGTPPPLPVVHDAVIDNVNASGPGMVMHTFTCSGFGTCFPPSPPVWDNFQFVSYTPNYGGAGDGAAEAANATFDPGTQQFFWNTVGAPRGDYVWSVRKTQGSQSDTGTLTVRVTSVPEPATISLLSLAPFAFLGIIRRR
jgi:hypothetical protein